MSIQDLRNKLKPVPVQSLDGADEQLNKSLGYGNRTDNTSDFLKVTNGRNLFRIYPPHEPYMEDGKTPNPFAEPCVTSFVPAYYPEKDDNGKEILGPDGKPKMRLSVKSVFNSRIHGKMGTNGQPICPKDLIDEFVRITNENAKLLYPDNEDQRKHYARGVYGVYSKDPAKKINGITYRTAWVCYADKIEGEKISFGRWEIGKSVKNRLNKIAAVEASNEPLGTDPFTDLDEGRAVIVIYNKDAEKAEDYYTTEIDNATIDEMIGDRRVKVQKVYPITDEQLEHFAKQDPLSKIYRNVFTRRDFDFQLTGLSIVDKKYEMGIFESEEFQRIAEEILSYYPEEEKKESTTKSDEPITVSTTLTVTEIVTKESGDDLDLLSREELKVYASEGKMGIIVKPVTVMSDDDLRNEIREWRLAKEIEFEKVLDGSQPLPNEIAATSETPVVNKQPEVDSTPVMSSAEKLAKLKAARDAAAGK